MDQPTVSEIVDDVLDSMMGDDAFGDIEILPWLTDYVISGTSVPLSASDMDKVLNALMQRLTKIVKEAHPATRGKGL